MAAHLLKNKTPKTTYYNETIQQCYENDSEEILGIAYYHYFFNAVFSSALLLDTTDDDVRKVLSSGFCLDPRNSYKCSH